MATNKQRAAALLAHRIIEALREPVELDEVRSALGETTDFQPVTIDKVTKEATVLARDILERLRVWDMFYDFPEPTVAPAWWVTEAIEEKGKA